MVAISKPGKMSREIHPETSCRIPEMMGIGVLFISIVLLSVELSLNYIIYIETVVGIQRWCKELYQRLSHSRTSRNPVNAGGETS